MTSTRRRLTNGALVLAALAVGRLVTGALPTDEVVAAPVERTGVVGTPLQTRAFTVTLDRVLGAKDVFELGSPLSTPGVWVVTDLTVTTTRTPAAPGYAAIRAADGRLWEATPRGGLTCDPIVPGNPTHCWFRVDVPPDAVPGAELLLAADRFDQRFDDLAVIRLGVTAAQVTPWLALAYPKGLDIGTTGPKP